MSELRVAVDVSDPASHALVAEVVSAAGGEVAEGVGDVRVDAVDDRRLGGLGPISPLRLRVIAAAELLPGGLDEVRSRVADAGERCVVLCPSLRPAACPERDTLAARLSGPTTSTLEWVAAANDDTDRTVRSTLIERYGWPMVRALVAWEPGRGDLDEYLRRQSGQEELHAWMTGRAALEPLLAARRRLAGDDADPERELLDHPQLAAIEALELLADMDLASDVGGLDELIDASLVAPDTVGEEQLEAALRAGAGDDLVIGSLAQLAARSIEVALAARSAV